MDEKEIRLVELVLAGRTEAFEPLVTPYRSALLGLAYRLTGNVEEAKEACQEALFRAYRYLPSFNSGRSFRNWLLAILVNCARTQTEKRRARSRAERRLDAAAAETARDPAAGPDGGDLLPRLKDALEILTVREKEVFLLRDIEEKPVRETADIIGCSSLSVRVHLSSARKKLRARLQGLPFGPRGERP